MARPKLTERRRLETLQAAVEVIADRGLCDTRIADVAAKAGSSPALILYYFGTKDRLLTEALAFAEDRFYLDTFHELAGMRHPTDRLVRLIELSCPVAGPKPEPEWTLWIELWSRALRDPEAARKREALDRRWRQTIAETVRAGQRGGEFADVDPDDLAYRLAAMMDGLAIQVLLRDSDMTRDRMREMCIGMVERELETNLIGA
ncbi:MAG: TetR/AcrR family transcriptional regulator [Actinomycetota bacterium]